MILRFPEFGDFGVMDQANKTLLYVINGLRIRLESFVRATKVVNFFNPSTYAADIFREWALLSFNKLFGVLVGFLRCSRRKITLRAAAGQIHFRFKYQKIATLRRYYVFYP